jgi:SAM-dependent methyltransferase
MDSALVAPRAQLRFRDGRRDVLNVDRWLGEADEIDHRVLARAAGSVLDIGCGPGRHVEALSQAKTDVLGMDLSPEFVTLAQGYGRPVVLQSVFDPIPGRPDWDSALLLDGSIGIGGCPVTLLRRVANLLASGGRALVETGGPTEVSESLELFLESGRGNDAWFAWASLSVVDAAAASESTGLILTDKWEDSGRWFVQLDQR